jgi:gingipain R
MKQLFFISAFLILTLSLLKASDGYQVQFNQPQNNVYELTFDLGDFNLSTETHDGVIYSKIIFDHSIFTNLKGFAELPYIHATVQLSPGKNVDLQIIESDYTDYNLDYPLLPSRGTIYRDQDPSGIPYHVDPGSITDKLYPEYLAKDTEPFIIKDIRGTSVYVYPFKINSNHNNHI